MANGPYLDLPTTKISSQYLQWLLRYRPDKKKVEENNNKNNKEDEQIE